MEGPSANDEKKCDEREQRESAVVILSFEREVALVAEERADALSCVGGEIWNLCVQVLQVPIPH